MSGAPQNPADTAISMPDKPICADTLIIIPVFNDWASIDKLLPTLNASLGEQPGSISVMLIDDGSTECPPDHIALGENTNINDVYILKLRTNLGHQRALAVGLAFTWMRTSSNTLVIMDADGEDAPSDVPRLLEHFRRTGSNKIVFAERKRRSENLIFRTFYHIYRGAHWLLTGRAVRVGNFSVLPRELVSRLVISSDLWNHYAATVFKSRVPTSSIHTARAERLDGRSSMNFVALVVHGLSAISIFSDIVAVRLLITLALLSGTSLAALLTIVAGRLSEGLSALTVGSVVWSLIFATSLNMGLFALCACFLTLSARTVSNFLPQRDYEFYVSRLYTVTSS
jgi:glycosyltransferase involved in cell wall biosynthesis